MTRLFFRHKGATTVRYIYTKGNNLRRVRKRPRHGKRKGRKVEDTFRVSQGYMTVHKGTTIYMCLCMCLCVTDRQKQEEGVGEVVVSCSRVQRRVSAILTFPRF